MQKEVNFKTEEFGQRTCSLAKLGQEEHAGSATKGGFKNEKNFSVINLRIFN